MKLLSQIECNCCGKKFAYAKRLSDHIGKKTDCRRHYEEKQIELPKTKERKRRNSELADIDHPVATLQENESDEIDINMKEDGDDSDYVGEEDVESTIEAEAGKTRLEEESLGLETNSEDEEKVKYDENNEGAMHQRGSPDDVENTYEAKDQPMGEGVDEAGINTSESAEMSLRKPEEDKTEEKDEVEQQKRKTRGEYICEACGKKFARNLKRLVVHIEKHEVCKNHYLNNNIEVPVSKERVSRNEEKELATDISNPQNANLDENKDEAPDLTGVERELSQESCTFENENTHKDAKKTDQQMTAQLKNGKPYYPILLRVKIVREIERQISDNIEILEAIIDASKKNNVDPEIATEWWKRRKKYLELDEKRKTKPKALNPDDGLASINEKKGLEKSSEEIFAGENNENSDKLESKSEIVETIPMSW